MQPFDKGKFDKRFDDVYKIAIEKAGLGAYRVDRDPNVAIPIEDIESGIRNAEVCLADITLDNPNVWFELGYALALNKDVVLVCSDERTTKFPFDIQHRTVITYPVESPRDFAELSEKIVTRLKSILSKQNAVEHITSVSKDIGGLAPHEMAALTFLMTDSFDSDAWSVFGYIDRRMSSAGFASIATALSLKALCQKKLVLKDWQQREHHDEPYEAYAITEQGEAWILENQDKISLKID